MYVYLQCDPGVFTVGFFDPAGDWEPENDHDSREAAALRVAFLNGGERAPVLSCASVAPGPDGTSA